MCDYCSLDETDPAVVHEVLHFINRVRPRRVWLARDLYYVVLSTMCPRAWQEKLAGKELIVNLGRRPDDAEHVMCVIRRKNVKIEPESRPRSADDR